MSKITIPIRYYKDYEGGHDYAYEDFPLTFEQCAFLLVDVDGRAPNPTTENFIAPALAAARECGMLVAYVHNDLYLVADTGNIVAEVWGRTKKMEGLEGWAALPDFKPEYLDCVAPRPHERNIPKWIWSGFHDTFLDQHLRSHDIKTLLVVGYSQRACLHYTCAEAVGRNYRVILLRDCSNAPEMPDTKIEGAPDYGWINRITLRNFEHLIGYTALSADFAQACRQITR